MVVCGNVVTLILDCWATVRRIRLVAVVRALLVPVVAALEAAVRSVALLAAAEVVDAVVAGARYLQNFFVLALLSHMFSYR